MQTFFPTHFEILPPVQKTLWSMFDGVSDLGFVLYGGTAVALRLGHRDSVDFDFFSAEPLHKQSIYEKFPFLINSTPYFEDENSLCLNVPSPNLAEGMMKVSFFGQINFGRVATPQWTEDGVMQVASPLDLLGTKLVTLLKRVEVKDYLDIAVLLNSGLDLLTSLAAAKALFPRNYNPLNSLAAMVYFNDKRLSKLSEPTRKFLTEQVASIDFENVYSLEPLPILANELVERNLDFKAG